MINNKLCLKAIGYLIDLNFTLKEALRLDFYSQEGTSTYFEFNVTY